MSHGTETIATVTRDEILRRLRDPRLAIVNVLPREAFSQARIPTSISLPFDEIVSRARSLRPSIPCSACGSDWFSDAASSIGSPISGP